MTAQCGAETFTTHHCFCAAASGLTRSTDEFHSASPSPMLDDAHRANAGVHTAGAIPHRVWKMTGSRCMFTQDGALIQTDASEGATLSMTSEKSQFMASIMSGSMSRSKTIR